ncbi:hypothetical protein D3C87_1782030 [compost metagenome]
MMGLKQGNGLHSPLCFVYRPLAKCFGLFAHQFIAFFKTITPQVEQVCIANDLLQQSLRVLRHFCGHDTAFYLGNNFRIDTLFR